MSIRSGSTDGNALDSKFPIPPQSTFHNEAQHSNYSKIIFENDRIKITDVSEKGKKNSPKKDEPENL